jgi:hypothetical protein
MLSLVKHLEIIKEVNNLKLMKIDYNKKKYVRAKLIII